MPLRMIFNTSHKMSKEEFMIFSSGIYDTLLRPTRQTGAPARQNTRNWKSLTLQ